MPYIIIHGSDHQLHTIATIHATYDYTVQSAHRLWMIRRAEFRSVPYIEHRSVQNIDVTALSVTDYGLRYTKSPFRRHVQYALLWYTTYHPQ